MPSPEFLTNDLLWAIKGAGSRFGIAISVTFKAYMALIYSIRNWVIPLNDNLEARLRLSDFCVSVARELSRNFSIDAYMYWDTDKLHLGVTMFETSTTTLTAKTPTCTPKDKILGLETI